MTIKDEHEKPLIFALAFLGAVAILIGCVI